jgi:hypothetical protein
LSAYPRTRGKGQSGLPIPRFRVRVDIQIPRERNRAFSQLVFELNINQSGPEALNQVISKREHLPRPTFSGQKFLSSATRNGSESEPLRAKFGQPIFSVLPRRWKISITLP